MIDLLKEDLIFCDAEPGQLAYIRKYQLEQWRKRQEQEIRMLTEKAFMNCRDPQARGWQRWVTDYICRRFHDMDRWEWVNALAIMDDETLLWQYPEGKPAMYLKYVRDYARRYAHDGGLE